MPWPNIWLEIVNQRWKSDLQNNFRINCKKLNVLGSCHWWRIDIVSLKAKVKHFAWKTFQKCWQIRLVSYQLERSPYALKFPRLCSFIVRVMSKKTSKLMHWNIWYIKMTDFLWRLRISPWFFSKLTDKWKNESVFNTVPMC